MRKIIYDLLSLLYPTYSVGQHDGVCLNPYLVVKFNGQDTSRYSDLGGWQVLEVMVYTPDTSISRIDEILEQVKLALVSDRIECTNRITPDFHDTTVKAYMRSIQFRQPKGL